jgi:NCAIR mutase (PurE)-related protein
VCSMRAKKKDAKSPESGFIEHIGKTIKFDVGRLARLGFPEVVLAEGKEIEEIFSVIEMHISKRKSVVLSRLDQQIFNEIADNLREKLIYTAKGRVAYYRGSDAPAYRGKVAVVTAGTSDIHIAQESIALLDFFRIKHDEYFDCGIAGLHRSIAAAKAIAEGDYDVVLVFAGMEGALASVLASLLPHPIIGIPTSSGYGNAGSGVAALNAMLQSCVPGLVVLNIDNGVGAVAATVRMLRKIGK